MAKSRKKCIICGRTLVDSNYVCPDCINKVGNGVGIAAGAILTIYEGGKYLLKRIK